MVNENWFNSSFVEAKSSFVKSNGMVCIVKDGHSMKGTSSFHLGWTGQHVKAISMIYGTMGVLRCQRNTRSPGWNTYIGTVLQRRPLR